MAYEGYCVPVPTQHAVSPGWVMNKANAMNQMGMAVVLLGAYENGDHVGL